MYVSRGINGLKHQCLEFPWPSLFWVLKNLEISGENSLKSQNILKELQIVLLINIPIFLKNIVSRIFP